MASEEISTSIIGIVPARDHDVHLLINVYETPIDADGINSSIQRIDVGDDGFEGVVVLNDDVWITSLATADGTRLVATSMEGDLRFYDGAQWSVVAVESEEALNGVFAVTPALSFAVGLKGSIFQAGSDGLATSVYTGSARLNAIHGCSTTCIFAVGDDGQIVRFDGHAWEVQPVLTNANLLCAHCVAPDRVYVGGAEGICFGWDGAAWFEIDAGGATLSDFALYDGTLYAAAGSAGVLKLEARALVPFKKVTLYRLCATDRFLFGAGSSFFCWFDGTQWRGDTIRRD